MFEIWGALFIIIVGTLGHFVYEWSNHNKLVGYFFAVNESTWEHIKLVIGPSLLWFIFEAHHYFGNLSLIYVKFITLLFMIIIMPTIFYGYKFFTKKSYLIADIIIFLITVISGQMLFHYLMQLDFSNTIYRHIGAVGLILVFFQYITNTYVPSHNFIFKDPITKKYGISGHSHEHE